MPDANDHPRLEDLLACPACRHSPLVVAADRLTCGRCGWARTVNGRIISVEGEDPVASFDEKHDLVDEHNHHPVVWDVCYSGQCEAITAALEPGDVLLDVGCGPAAPYTKPAGVFTIGVDPSRPSLEANSDLDLAFHSSAGSLPLGDGTVDVVVAIYAVHHMVGTTVPESWRNVERTFTEINRVAKPGAQVLMLEICPWLPVWWAERIGWRTVHRLVGPQVDFVFWRASRLARLGERAFPGATLEVQRFGTSPWATFPPVIGLPGLKIPWFFYPFDVSKLHWRFSGRSAAI